MKGRGQCAYVNKDTLTMHDILGHDIKKRRKKSYTERPNETETKALHILCIEKKS